MAASVSAVTAASELAMAILPNCFRCFLRSKFIKCGGEQSLRSKRSTCERAPDPDRDAVQKITPGDFAAHPQFLVFFHFVHQRISLLGGRGRL